MNSKIVLLDGAVGTSLWEKTDNKVPVWRYNIENPEIVSELHREYIEAGSKVILANTFGANGPAVSKSGYSVDEIVSTGVRLAKESTAGTDVKVALSAGPLSELLEPYGDLEPLECEEIYTEQISAGMSQNPDVILLQTFMDLEMLKIAAGVAGKYDVPVWCAMSFDKNGRTMMGNSVEDMVRGLSDYRVDAIGLNCSLGPDLALPVIAKFKEFTNIPLIFKPNAGKSTVKNGKVETEFDIDSFVDDVIQAVDLGVTYIGGCCGSNPSYISKLREKLEEKYPD